MTDTKLIVTTRIESGVFIITVKGTMKGCKDETNVHELVREQVAKGNGKIIINMKDTKYINSSGSGILFACYQTIHKEFPFTKVNLSQPNEKNRSILKLTKMDVLFNFYESDEEAIAAINAQ